METLTRHFDTALETPDGIKKLRELILSLAMKGKLVPQDPKDQPASELLKDIEKEKERLVKEGKIKKQELLLPIKPEEIPYELPNGWEWVRLGNVVLQIVGGGTPSKDNLLYWNGKIPWASVKDLNVDMYLDKTIDSITEQGVSNSSTNIVPKNNIIICTRMGLGKIAINNIEVAINQDLKALFLSKFIYQLFFFMFYKTLNIVGQGMTVKGIRQDELINILLPLPPLAEQKCIVEKIDQLMSLCDKLEVERNDRDTKRITVHTAAVNRLLGASDKPAFDKSWSFITKNFNELYSVTPNVAELKKAILHLAVMGKLVPQDKNDQPASELLKDIEKDASTRLSAGKARLVKEGKIKKQEPLPAIKAEEIPYQIPEGWVWCRLGSLTEVLAGNSFSSNDFQNTDGIKCIKITNAGVHEFIETDDYLPTGFLNRFSSFIVNAGDIIIALTRPYIKDGLKVSICPPSYNNSLLNQRVAAIKSISKENSDFIYLYLRTDIVLRRYQERFNETGLQPNLKMKDITELLIPLPPLAEQKRIVAKIDQLMEMCNSLEQGIKVATEKRSRVLGAVLARV